MAADGNLVQHTGGGLAKLEKIYGKLKLLEIEAGVQGPSGNELAMQHDDDGKLVRGPLTYATLATIHHFGSGDGRIPARPFMNIKNKSVVSKIAKVIARDINDSIDPTAALERGALRLQAILRKQIVAVKSPRLAKSTKKSRERRRGDTTANPLVDTGGLTRSISAIAKINGRQIGSTGGKQS